MSARSARFGIALASAFLAAVAIGFVIFHRAPPTPLTHDMYVWQLVWTAPVRTALDRTANAVSRIRVLALEVDPRGAVRRAGMDTERLRATGKPLVAVVRIDGRSEDLPQALSAIQSLLLDLRAPPVRITALEIDFDCATSKLADYVQFLRAVRALLDRDTQLTITALPAWIASAHLPLLVDQVDDVVLQVHSVTSPSQGLFLPGPAYDWLQAFARVAQRPFKVALPTYGSRVGWDQDGRISSIESEMASRSGSAYSRELLVDPEVIAAFLRRLAREPVRGLSGVVWFRMPTDADRRAWSIDTFLAVIAGKPLQHGVAASLVPQASGGTTRDLVIANNGNIDAPLPLQICFRGNCRSADGVNGYRLQRDADSIHWVRQSMRMVRAGSSFVVGWADCVAGGSALEIMR